MKRLLACALCGFFSATMLAAPFAAAHAGLKNSLPAAGATLAAAPRQIALTFNEAIEPAFSSVTLNDASGKPVGQGKAAIDGSDRATLRLEVPALTAGVYGVKWIAVGHDGHRSKGDFKFTVK